MSTMPTASRIAEVLPGSWMLGASNILFWLDRRHGDPVFTFDAVSANPLIVAETIEFAADDGRPRVLRGRSKWKGGAFAWRGEGRHWFMRQRWRVLGVDDEGSIVVAEYRGTRLIPGGLAVLVRRGTEAGELRTRVASRAASLGITPEGFATLTWIA